MTIEQLQTAILDAISARDSLVTEYRDKNVKAAKAEHAYRQKYAREMLNNIDGKNAEERKARTETATDNEMFQAKLLEAESEGLLQAIRAKADAISALQSLLRLERMEAEAIHYGQRTGA